MSLDTLNKRLLVALGTSEQTAQIIIDHIDELRTQAGQLRTEIICLKQDLKDATAGKCVCSDCGKTVWNAWRDSGGHHCLTCLATERDKLRATITEAIREARTLECNTDPLVDRILAPAIA